MLEIMPIIVFLIFLIFAIFPIGIVQWKINKNRMKSDQTLNEINEACWKLEQKRMKSNLEREDA